jgi:putative membrane protein insertion efficiency factor
MSFYETCVRSALRAYKLTLSPLIGRQCRFLPTCSEYAAQALIEQGPMRGAWLAARRLCRCHPFGGSGYDPPPPPRTKTEKPARGAPSGEVEAGSPPGRRARLKKAERGRLTALWDV